MSFYRTYRPKVIDEIDNQKVRDVLLSLLKKERNEFRTLRDGISLTPVSGDYKVYIIDEVHMLTTEAFNALLKTLEEPPPHAVFVLATTEKQKVPATIVSRCQS